MICDRCKDNIEAGDETVLHGQTLCEDCYMDMLSPAKACDPWAEYNAKSFLKKHPDAAITETQSNILELLKETGGTESGVIVARLQIKPSDLEREIATLRHMEKVKGALRDGKKIICLW